MHRGFSGRTLASALGLAAVVGYAWWATGVEPFTVGAYLAVGIPVIIVAALGLGAPGSRAPAVAAPTAGAPSAGPAPVASTEDATRSAWHRAAPWIIILVVSVSLEGVALALGGRSEAVPTLSTVVDHALRWHPVRLLLFCLWLSVGAVPAVRAAAPTRRRAA